ncbi:hypothetical protein [Hymenobacter fodinae]|uniref:Uncharacterized protein n=1 Tax=Hymenobacter fodinae TaxID=2510796 RepID=A0A4Z0P372_9BACT|nr:hypothetical protein [Hymenobacter fodinae]TGE04609.1 hypothetical protein EU556_20710 [Hymenobacter fodinae]
MTQTTEFLPNELFAVYFDGIHVSTVDIPNKATKYIRSDLVPSPERAEPVSEVPQGFILISEGAYDRLLRLVTANDPVKQQALEEIDRALIQVSGGLCSFTAEGKHALLKDAQSTLLKAKAALEAAANEQQGGGE